MEDVLENIGRGIRDSHQRLHDARVRLATHRSTLDKTRLELVRAMSPLLLLHAAKATSQLPSHFSRSAACTPSPPLLSDDSPKTPTGVGCSPGHDVPHCMEDHAGGVEDTIIIAPAHMSSVVASTVRERAPPAAASRLALEPPSSMLLALTSLGTSSCADFYSAMATRTQQLEEQRSSYRRIHMLRAAKIQIAQTWVREVLPWFERAVDRGFFEQVVSRLDALDQRLSRLCRRLALDRHQYIPTYCCCCSSTAQLGMDTEASGPIESREKHGHHHRRCALSCSPLTCSECSGRQVGHSCGSSKQVASGSDDCKVRQPVQRRGCTGRGACLSMPLSRDGRARNAVADLASSGVSHHPVRALWHQYIQMMSLTDAVTDKQPQRCEESDNTRLPVQGLSAPLLRTPRSLRHVWHVILNGLTGSCAGAPNETMATRSTSFFSSTDALLRHLSDLVCRYSARRTAPSTSQARLPLCNRDDEKHEPGSHGIRGGAPGDRPSGGSAVVEVGLSADMVTPSVDPIPFQICVLFCCLVQLSVLAKQCNAIRAEQPSFYAPPLPQLVYTGKVRRHAEEDVVGNNGIGGLDVVRCGWLTPIAGLARAPDIRSLCHHTAEGQLADSLGVVYHALPRLLTQLTLEFQRRISFHGVGSDAPQGQGSEAKAAAGHQSTGQHPCASSAEWGCHGVTHNPGDADAVMDAAVDAAPWATVGDAARDVDAFGQWWSSFVLSLLTTDSSPSSAPLSNVPFAFVRALRVGSLFRTLADAPADECGERRPSPASDASTPALLPATATPLTTVQANSFTVETQSVPHSTQPVPTVAHRVGLINPASSPFLGASALLSSLRQVELQTRQQWQSMETRLSVARSMASAALKRAAHGDGGEACDLDA